MMLLRHNIAAAFTGNLQLKETSVDYVCAKAYQLIGQRTRSNAQTC